jgi:hypothetical protein
LQNGKDFLIMTHDEFIILVRQPESVQNEQIPALKELVERYPYFVSPRVLLLKAFKDSNDVRFSGFLNETSIYSSDRKWLHDYIYPEKTIVDEPQRFERVSKTSGNYFDMINTIESEGVDSKQSLKNMAEKLKEARSLVVKQSVEINKEPKIQSTELKVDEVEVKTLLANMVINLQEISEINAKKLISERKFTEAIEILRALNLNNPKKSVYFADQIRFLEKVISNSKK